MGAYLNLKGVHVVEGGRVSARILSVDRATRRVQPPSRRR
jgi:hypothetical protein